MLIFLGLVSTVAAVYIWDYQEKKKLTPEQRKARHDEANEDRMFW